MKCILLLILAAGAAVAQSGSGAISGKLLETKTNKPVPAARVIAVRAGLPPFSRSTHSGADGSFSLSSLPAGSFSICVQVPGDQD